MRRFAGAITLLCLLAGAATPSLAAKKLAFVVGIDSYDSMDAARQLKKAVNDATAIGAALGEVGFAADAHANLSLLDFNRSWQRFLQQVEPGDTVAVFFSGHGVELKGQNFLLPRDIPAVGSGEEELLRKQSIALVELMEELAERKPDVSLFIVDACRDNPFVGAGGRSIGGARGLALVAPPQGSFVMYSAGAGETALDRLSDADPDPNSIYTRKLLPLLRKRGLNLVDAARKVRSEVSALASAERGHKQTPAYYDQMNGDFCIAGCDGGTAAVAPVNAPGSKGDPAVDWQVIQSTKSAAVVRIFLGKYGDDPLYGELAREKLALLEQPAEPETPKVVEPPTEQPLENAAKVEQPKAATDPLAAELALTRTVLFGIDENALAQSDGAGTQPAALTDLATWKVAKRLRLGGALDAGGVSSDRRALVIVGSRDGVVHVLDTVARKETSKFKLKDYETYELRFAGFVPTSRVIGIGLANVLKLFDPKGTLYHQMSMDGFRPESMHAVGGEGRFAVLWSNFDSQTSVIQLLEFDGEAVNQLAEWPIDVRLEDVDFDAAGQSMFAHGYDNKYRFYRTLLQPPTVATPSGSSECDVRFGSDATWVTSLCLPEGSKVPRLSTFQADDPNSIIGSAELTDEESTYITDISPARDYLALGTTNIGKIMVYPSYIQSGSGGSPTGILLDKSGQNVSGAYFTADGGLVSGSGDNNVRFWGSDAAAE